MPKRNCWSVATFAVWWMPHFFSPCRKECELSTFNRPEKCEFHIHEQKTKCNILLSSDDLDFNLAYSSGPMNLTGWKTPARMRAHRWNTNEIMIDREGPQDLFSNGLMLVAWGIAGTADCPEFSSRSASFALTKSLGPVGLELHTGELRKM